MTTYIVTDLGYGDCGKGTSVDYLTRSAQYGQTMVVRHNGGPQAGHNVVTEDGRHHEFAQFGAGSLYGAKTFLSRFMLINPLNMMREAEHLIELGEQDIWARTFVDSDAMIVTPWHVAINRLLELARGAGRHGSCGQGVGVAMKQNIDHPGLTIRVKHLTDSGLWPRLDALRMQLATTYGDLSGDNPHWSALQDDELSQYLADRYQQWSRNVHVVPSDYLGLMIDGHEHTIFEGSQGVLLDEWYGFHPYTTWSTCTNENAVALLSDVGRSDVTRLGVIRAVTTRHGAGPHVTADKYLTDMWHEPHNATGLWQGSFRVGPLDLVAHRYAAAVCGGVDQLVVTNLDRAQQWLYCNSYNDINNLPIGSKDNLAYQEATTNYLLGARPTLTAAVSSDALLDAIEQNLGAVAITSYGATAADKHACTAAVAS